MKRTRVMDTALSGHGGCEATDRAGQLFPLVPKTAATADRHRLGELFDLVASRRHARAVRWPRVLSHALTVPLLALSPSGWPGRADRAYSSALRAASSRERSI